MSNATAYPPIATTLPADFNGASFLTSLPPEFVSSLPLEALLGNAQVVPLLGRMFLAYGGDKAAMGQFRFPKKLLKLARRERTKSQWLAAGKAFTERPDAISNSILFDLVMAKVNRLCVELVEKKASNHAAFAHLPPDILQVLDSVTECLAAIVSLAVISATAGLRGQAWESSKDLSTAIKRLKDSKGELREAILSIGGELAAVQDQPIAVDSATYPSALHAVFGLAGRALDTISLARSPSGGKLFLGALNVPCENPTSYSDCLPVAAGLFKLAMPHSANLLPMAQQESCRVANMRARRDFMAQPQVIHNNINVGTMNHSTIQQGCPGATQVVSVEPDEHKAIGEILARITELVGSLPLDGREGLEADVETLKAQMRTTIPKQSIIKACLSSIRVSLETVSAKAAATGVGMAAAALAEKAELIRRIGELLSHWNG